MVSATSTRRAWGTAYRLYSSNVSTTCSASCPAARAFHSPSGVSRQVWMCSGDRSSSAQGPIALRHSAASSWSPWSSSVLSLCTIRGPGCDSVITGQAYGCTGRRPPTTVRRVTDALTVLFMPESAYGPTNQCIGLGKVLLDRGHRVVFAAERSWAGRLAPYGFVEDLVALAEPDPDATDEAAGQFWIDFIAE